MNVSFNLLSPRAVKQDQTDSNRVRIKSLIIRNEYKKKLLQEKSVRLDAQKKHKYDIKQLSEQRFSRSPFKLNILAMLEINEHKIDMSNRLSRRKSKSSIVSKAARPLKKDAVKLRKDMKIWHKGDGYLGEKILEDKILNKSTQDQKFISQLYFARPKMALIANQNKSFHL